MLELQMNEKDFVDSIDCCFPYEDEEKWRELILQAKDISANAAFCLLYEIAMKPQSSHVSAKRQLEIVEVWAAENLHPLAEQAIVAAKAIISGVSSPVPQVLEWMDSVQPFKDSFCALAIFYSACDDVDGSVDKKWHSIVNSWKEADS